MKANFCPSKEKYKTELYLTKREILQGDILAREISRVSFSFFSAENKSRVDLWMSHVARGK